MKSKYLRIGGITITTLIILLIFTNPSLVDFKEYLPIEKPQAKAKYEPIEFYEFYRVSYSRKMNFILFSIFERTDTDIRGGDAFTETYYGFLNNFYLKNCLSKYSY
jgi:hypothetical protein